MDDKAKIPVGEPACADVATCHMNKSLTKSKVNLESTDYNYHCGNITPSVNLLCNIPESASESFYSEQIYVGLKGSVFKHLNQYSMPLNWSTSYDPNWNPKFLPIWYCSQMVVRTITWPFWRMYTVNVFWCSGPWHPKCWKTCTKTKLQ